MTREPLRIGCVEITPNGPTAQGPIQPAICDCGAWGGDRCDCGMRAEVLTGSGAILGTRIWSIRKGTGQ